MKQKLKMKFAGAFEKALLEKFSLCLCASVAKE
jgi:hypothetical protein